MYTFLISFFLYKLDNRLRKQNYTQVDILTACPQDILRSSFYINLLHFQRSKQQL